MTSDNSLFSSAVINPCFLVVSIKDLNSDIVIVPGLRVGPSNKRRIGSKIKNLNTNPMGVNILKQT